MGDICLFKLHMPTGSNLSVTALFKYRTEGTTQNTEFPRSQTKESGGALHKIVGKVKDVIHPDDQGTSLILLT